MKILFILGTRPEAIKLAPVILRLREDPRFTPRLCVTAQHRGLLDQVLAVFRIKPDHDLNTMRPAQTLFTSTSSIVAALEPVFEQEQPDLVIVQGDTTTTFCGALAGFYNRTPVAHVEAGLRTWDVFQPYPEEMNRLLTTRLSSLHFAATEWGAENLRRESVPDSSIFVTGNTGIDAVLHVVGELERGNLTAPAWPELDPQRKLIVVTAHRRESFGQGMENLCGALATLAARPDVQIAFPVHPNPNVGKVVHARLGGHSNIALLEPLEYVPFVDLMRRATLLLTDSGGVQEEGPSLGKPILVLREKTERPEAVEAGTVELVGTNPEKILRSATALLDDEELRVSKSRIHNPYGDGLASTRIHDLIHSFLNR